MPDEPRQAGRADWAAEIYGLRTWATSFSPRQLLSLITCVETLKELDREIRGAMDEERARAVGTYLAFALSKATNYNSNLASWNAPRAVIRSVFDRHDFSFKWTFAEFDSASNLLPWGTDQVYDAYKGIAELNSSIQATLEGHASGQGALSIINGSAISLSGLADRSVLTIVTDPPYYDNVMYAELSDFFYVWLKRTVGDVYPGWFATQLTDKDAEAVVNVARFADLGGNKVELAERDYERKMEAAFREMHRVLADDGVLTVIAPMEDTPAFRAGIMHGDKILTIDGASTENVSLQDAVRKVKEATAHLTGMKIAVMGCVVNGPGEMAGADYGYVGAGEGKVHIYRGTEAVLKNIPEAEALDKLLELIRNDQAGR